MPRERTAARVAGSVLLAGHGGIHLIGVALEWRLGQPGTLRYADIHPAAGSGAGVAVGVAWLIAAALFVVAACLLAVRSPHWRPTAAAAAVVSIAVLVPAASLAGAGIAVDVGVLVAVVLAGATKTSWWSRTVGPRFR